MSSPSPNETVDICKQVTSLTDTIINAFIQCLKRLTVYVTNVWLFSWYDLRKFETLFAAMNAAIFCAFEFIHRCHHSAILDFFTCHLFTSVPRGRAWVGLQSITKNRLGTPLCIHLLTLLCLMCFLNSHILSTFVSYSVQYFFYTCGLHTRFCIRMGFIAVDALQIKAQTTAMESIKVA